MLGSIRQPRSSELPDPPTHNTGNDDDDDGDAVDEDVDSEVILAQCPSEYPTISLVLVITDVMCWHSSESSSYG
jgi:hypothetical protein